MTSALWMLTMRGCLTGVIRLARTSLLGHLVCFSRERCYQRGNGQKGCCDLRGIGVEGASYRGRSAGQLLFIAIWFVLEQFRLMSLSLAQYA
eukprot:1510062-Rhodomonas_salina.1